MKKFAAVVLVALILMAGALFVFAQTDLFKVTTNSSSETALVQDRIVELSEWTTLKYEYSHAIVSRTDKSIPFTDINFAEAIKLIEYSGYLKAGSDLSQMEMDYDDESEKMSVRIPKAQILDNVVETEKTTVEDIKGNIFSDYPTQKVIDEVNENKKQLEEEKIDPLGDHPGKPARHKGQAEGNQFAPLHPGMDVSGAVLEGFQPGVDDPLTQPCAARHVAVGEGHAVDAMVFLPADLRQGIDIRAQALGVDTQLYRTHAVLSDPRTIISTVAIKTVTPSPRNSKARERLW